MSKFSVKQSLGEIVLELPGAAKVFEKYKIDFCCGGRRSLGEALAEVKLDENEVLNSLDEEYENAKAASDRVDFREMTDVELIDFIVNTHHVYVKKVLPEISDLSSAILRAHGVNHPELFKVYKLFHGLKSELEQHLIKEEEILFPLIRTYSSTNDGNLLNKIKAVISELDAEHVAAGDVLKNLRALTDDYSVPGDGCPTYERVFLLLPELEADLFRHIHLENNILFLKFA